MRPLLSAAALLCLASAAAAGDAPDVRARAALAVAAARRPAQAPAPPQAPAVKAVPCGCVLGGGSEFSCPCDPETGCHCAAGKKQVPRPPAARAYEPCVCGGGCQCIDGKCGCGVYGDGGCQRNFPPAKAARAKRTGRCAACRCPCAAGGDCTCGAYCSCADCFDPDCQSHGRRSSGERASWGGFVDAQAPATAPATTAPPAAYCQQPLYLPPPACLGPPAFRPAPFGGGGGGGSRLFGGRRGGGGCGPGG
jgi:hypothetical protein